MTFGVAVKGLIYLFEAVGYTDWQPELKKHLAIWQQTGDASAHLSIYGGMGSFNDSSPDLEPFTHAAYDCLASICYRIAWEKQFMPNDWAGVTPRVLQGSACRVCSFEEVSGRDIDWFLSRPMVDPMIRKGMIEGNVIPIVDSILNLDIPGLLNAREAIREKVMHSGISVRDRDVRGRQCTSCGSPGTVVYRWDDHGTGFAPSADSLKARYLLERDGFRHNPPQ